MPKIISAAEQYELINMMLQQDDGDNYVFSQREIEYRTGLSRPYIRKIAASIGHQFPRNGIEIKGKLCMCTACGVLFRKAPSRANRAKNKFCSKFCKDDFSKGIHHSNWIDGRSVNTFSKWIQNQQGYKDFKKIVLERDNYTCQITGSKENVDVHHIRPKAENMSPELALDPNNGVCISEPAHIRIHQLISSGVDFEEAIDQVKEEFKQGKLVCKK